ncbi:MAG TPA: glycosyltransferase family 2 protein [Geminicoccaceae bacterium]
MLVSVVMPIYNGEAFLREAIQSVLDQTHADFELVAVDDGSSDRSAAIVAEFAALDPRVRLIRQANAGGAAARNRALAEARAEWIVNLDHDDLMLPRRIERQLAFLRRHPDVRVFASRAHYISASGRIFGATKLERLADRADFERRVASGAPIGLNHPSVCMHRPTILEVGGYRPAREGAEDIDLWNRVAERGHLILQQPEILTQYRIHEGAISQARTRQNWLTCEWVVACMAARRAGRPEPLKAEYLRLRAERPWLQRLDDERRLFARVNYRAGGFHAANRQYLRALAHLLAAGAAWPTYTLGRLHAQLPRPDRPAGAERRQRPLVARPTP